MRNSLLYSMEKILERYEHYTYAEKALMSSDIESQVSTQKGILIK